MFIAALLTTAKTGKETECPSRDEWVKKLWYLDTTGYYSTLQKKEAMPSAAAYMQLHYLEEVRQKDKRHKISRMWSLTSNTDEPIFGDGQGGLACCSLWGRKESDTTERLN